MVSDLRSVAQDLTSQSRIYQDQRLRCACEEIAISIAESALKLEQIVKS